MAVITMTQWARLHAKAWLEPDFKELLEKDPAKALTADVRKEFGIRDEAKLFDLNDPSYGGGTDESGTEPALRDMDEQELQGIIKDGKLRNDHPAKMMPSEWISYPPLYTKPLEHPDGPTYAAGPGSKTISLAAWAKIFAYMFLPLKEYLQPKFENDPASTVKTIVELIKADFGVSIDYTKGETALFRLGDPPKENIISFQDLRGIRDNPNTYARVMVRLTC